MPLFHKLALATAVLAVTSGCSTLALNEQQARDDTRAVGLMTQALSASSSQFQKQRDAVAVASQIQRDALENLAVRFETDNTGTVAAWRVAAQTDRVQVYDTLRSEVEKLLIVHEQQQERQREQAAQLAKSRSAVSFQTEKINAAAIGLVGLADAPSAADNSKFLLQFIQDVRTDIANDSEKAAATATSQALASANGPAKGVKK